MEDELLVRLLSWFMEQDPWDMETPHDQVSDFLDDLARTKGFQNWVEAYHWDGG